MHFSDYVKQLTYLLFLKMADERTQAPHNQTSIVPEQWGWQTLEALGDEKGMLGLMMKAIPLILWIPEQARE